MLEIQNLVLRFGGITALEGVSFTVADDEICGLIGPNGAGKTSLFNCVTRVYLPTEGTITYDGQTSWPCGVTRWCRRASHAPSRTSRCSRR